MVTRWTAVLMLGSACTPTSTPTPAGDGSVSAPAPDASSILTAELPWNDAVSMIRDKRVVCALPVSAGRVYLCGERASYVTTAPDADALGKLLDEVDPKHDHIGTTHFYEQHREVSWAEAERVLRSGRVNWVEENDAHRVFITTSDEARSAYATFAPNRDAVGKILDEVKQRPQYAKHIRFREIRWLDAVRLLREKRAGRVSAHHGKRVTLRDAGDDELRTYEPNGDDAVKLIEQIDPKLLLSIE